MYKTDFCFEKYIDVLKGDSLRKQMTCFRLSSHSLDIETGRFNGIDRSDRICRLCSLNQIESEYHFLLCCPAYANIRNKYFGHLPWPNTNTFVNILSSKRHYILTKTAYYLKESFKCRNEII
jgi:hypothetical protein